MVSNFSFEVAAWQAVKFFLLYFNELIDSRKPDLFSEERLHVIDWMS